MWILDLCSVYMYIISSAWGLLKKVAKLRIHNHDVIMTWARMLVKHLKHVLIFDEPFWLGPSIIPSKLPFHTQTRHRHMYTYDIHNPSVLMCTRERRSVDGHVWTAPWKWPMAWWIFQEDQDVLLTWRLQQASDSIDSAVVVIQLWWLEILRTGHQYWFESSVQYKTCLR